MDDTEKTNPDDAVSRFVALLRTQFRMPVSFIQADALAGEISVKPGKRQIGVRL